MPSLANQGREGEGLVADDFGEEDRAEGQKNRVEGLIVRKGPKWQG